MTAQVEGGHGHSAKDLAGSLAKAVRSALDGAAHEKVIIVITNITEHDGEFNVNVECIMIDDENSPPIRSRSLGDTDAARERQKQQEALEEFHKAELDAAEEERQKKARDYTSELLSTFFALVDENSYHIAKNGYRAISVRRCWGQGQTGRV